VNKKYTKIYIYGLNIIGFSNPYLSQADLNDLIYDQYIQYIIDKLIAMFITTPVHL
jgi:hypothetical protein